VPRVVLTLLRTAMFRYHANEIPRNIANEVMDEESEDSGNAVGKTSTRKVLDLGWNRGLSIQIR
jgi:hypothetical protein